jgi:tRNA-specific 2-thiouridylase
MARVCVALSGGVDSAVSAALLQRAGHDVFAVFLKVWQPDFLDCTQEEDRKSAKRVAASLGVPFTVLDCADTYKSAVIDVMVRAYARGETPNPDIACNAEVKFGVLWNYARKHGAEFLATGLYAQTKRVGDHVFLAKGKDPLKDQVYFLSRISDDVVPHCMFPVGGFEKKKTRRLAAQLKIPVAQKKDSQGLCFMGMVDMASFLKELTPLIPGNVLDEQGNVVGHHTGAQQFTLGQRHGFTRMRADQPGYVTAVNSEKNTITISESVPQGSHEIHLTAFIPRTQIDPERHYDAQVRYHGTTVACTVHQSRGRAILRLEQPVLVSPQQIVVLYDGDLLVGSGIAQ